MRSRTERTISGTEGRTARSRTERTISGTEGRTARSRTERTISGTEGRTARSRTERLAFSAAFCALGLILSYVEAIVPLEFLIPVPGFKPGLANLAVMATFFLLGPLSALGVSVTRITLSALLFGSPVSFVFSLSGGLLSYLSLLICYLFFKNILGCVGISVSSAVCHNIGQSIAASIMYGSGILYFYLPYILLLSLVTGTMSGIALYFILKNTVPLLRTPGTGVGASGLAENRSGKVTEYNEKTSETENATEHNEKTSETENAAEHNEKTSETGSAAELTEKTIGNGK